MSEKEILLVYDKECPACHFYCEIVRIRSDLGNLKLLDARESSAAMDRITELGLDIDQGMVLILDEELYYGSDAIHMLSLLGTRSGVFNRLNYWAFRNKRIAGVLYPVLRSMRNLLLKILGKTKINNLGLENNNRF